MSVINMSLCLNIAQYYFALKNYDRTLSVVKKLGKLPNVSLSDPNIEIKLKLAISSLTNELKSEL